LFALSILELPQQLSRALRVGTLNEDLRFMKLADDAKCKQAWARVVFYCVGLHAIACQPLNDRVSFQIALSGVSDNWLFEFHSPTADYVDAYDESMLKIVSVDSYRKSHLRHPKSS
jgi:hypothetical protein